MIATPLEKTVVKRIACLSLVIYLFCPAGCSNPVRAVVTRLNDSATLSGNLPANPLQWQIITSAIDHRDKTMYTVFGNGEAIAYARSHNDDNYPTGSILSVVTWSQTEDPRWFGGMTPDQTRSVEFVEIKGDAEPGRSYTYEQFTGAPLSRAAFVTTAQPNERAAYLLSLRSAVMP